MNNTTKNQIEVKTAGHVYTKAGENDLTRKLYEPAIVGVDMHGHVVLHECFVTYKVISGWGEGRKIKYTEGYKLRVYTLDELEEYVNDGLSGWHAECRWRDAVRDRKTLLGCAEWLEAERAAQFADIKKAQKIDEYCSPLFWAAWNELNNKEKEELVKLVNAERAGRKKDVFSSVSDFENRAILHVCLPHYTSMHRQQSTYNLTQWKSVCSYEKPANFRFDVISKRAMMRVKKHERFQAVDLVEEAVEAAMRANVA